LLSDATAKNLRGVTISGGEPFLQISPLVKLIKMLKEKTQLDIICFTGFDYSQLKNKKDENTKYILANIDILIDGKYVEEKNENNYLRGSSKEIMWINDKEIFIAGIPYKESGDK